MRSASLRCSQRAHCGSSPAFAKATAGKPGLPATAPGTKSFQLTALADAPEPCDTAFPFPVTVIDDDGNETPSRSFGVQFKRAHIAEITSNLGSRVPSSQVDHVGFETSNSLAIASIVKPCAWRKLLNLCPKLTLIKSQKVYETYLTCRVYIL